MGLSCQPTENAQLREHFQMRPGLTGVLVSHINPISDAHRVLKKDDIILSFDDVPIANDGSGTFQVFNTTIFLSDFCGVECLLMASDFLIAWLIFFCVGCLQILCYCKIDNDPNLNIVFN